MSLSTLFDRIFKAQKQREESRVRDYRSLVAQIASGTEPQADRLDQILLASGKSVEQLRADVELYQQRRAWREQYDALPKLNEEKTAIERQIAEAEKAFEAARRQYEAATDPLHARLRQVQEARNQAEAAKGRLQDRCPHVELVAELQQVRDEHREAHDRHMKLALGIKEAGEAAWSDWAEAQVVGRESRAEAFRERAEKLEAERVQMEAELPAAAQQLEMLVQREKAILERMLAP
jgi:chromosome segregation ATPase